MDELGFEKDASNDLSYSRMKYHTRKIHPHKVITDENGRQTLKKWQCCWVSTGSYSPFKTGRKSDFEPYGPGIVAYFQFLKYIIRLYWIMALFAVPSMIFYFSGNNQGASDIKTLLFSFSLGNMGSAQNSCSTGSYSTTSTDITAGEIQISCAAGTL